MKSNCIVCNKEFDKIRHAKTCSKECSNENKIRYKKSDRVKDRAKEINKNYKNSIKNDAEQLGLPCWVVIKYTPSFLFENPEVVATLKVAHLLTGRKDIPDEVKEIRKQSRVTPAEIARRKFVPKVRQCKICNSDYTGPGPQKTCSDKCSEDLNQRTIRANRERNKGKVYVRNKVKDRMRYEETYAKIRELAKSMGITTREARKQLVKKS